MTLDEAITHAFEKANDKKCSKDCRADHRQLGNWLKELKTLKAKKLKQNKQEAKRYSWEYTHPNYDAVLKSRKVGSGNFATVFNYTDDDGVKHWKTGWYSNRSNYTDDFADNFHGGNEQ